LVKITNVFGDQYRGQVGHAGVFAFWKGRQYRRKYVIPSNPNTTMQQAVRGFFTNAVSFWHNIRSLQRLVFSYLATGQVMSGFNLLVSRWQKAATTGATLPLEPAMGIKQIASATDDASTDDSLLVNHQFPLTDSPVVIGSLVYTGATTDPEQDAYIDLEMGDMRIPVDITNTHGGAGGGATLADGDKLVISYTSGGREVTQELLDTVAGGAAKFAARATIGVALRTEYYPIDIGSVVVQIIDATGPSTFQIESMEILNCAYTLAGTPPAATPQALIYFDKTIPLDGDSAVVYTSYTPIVGAKLEVVKVDTSFITWRGYSGYVGEIPLAQTIEDQTYDWNLSAAEYISVIRAAQTAVLATKHEAVEMTAAS